MSGRPPKKQPDAIDPALLTEPLLSASDLSLLDRGIHLFNEGRYWDAHEAWEELWHRRTEESRIFFQGIIQLAAALHLLHRPGRRRGALGNFAKAEEKLRLFRERFLGIEVRELLAMVEAGRAGSGPGDHREAPAPHGGPPPRITRHMPGSAG